MSLQRKLLFGFGSLLLILLITSGMSMVMLSRFGSSVQAIYHENYESVAYCDQIKQALDQLDDVARTATFSPSLAPVHSLNDAREQFRTNIQLELNNAHMPGEDEMARRLERQGNETIAKLEGLLATPAEGRQAMYSNDLQQLRRQALATTQQVSDLNLNNIRRFDSEIQKDLGSFRTMLIVFAAVGATLTVVSVILLARAIIRPMSTLMDSVGRIGAGNLELDIPQQATDEFGQLLNAFSTMAIHLREYRQSDHALLLQSRQTTQMAIDSLPDSVAVFNPSGEVAISNREARVHFGLQPGTLLTHLKLEWLQVLFSKTLESRQATEPRGYQSAIQLFDDGEERFLLPRAVPMFDEGSNVIGVVVILVDVTRLRRADEIKSGLVSTVSHELKTPLTSARMGIHMLSMQTMGPLNTDQLGVVNATKREIDRLHRIIENLLNMSRIEQGKQSLKFVAMSARAIVDQAVEPLRGEIEKKQIGVEISVEGDVPPVQADPSCIVHALTNLISNAVKFSPAAAAVRVLVEKKAEGVQFRVSDSGPGIAKEHRGRLFERFYRVPSASGPSGAGLGLSIAKEIVEAHGGKIWLEPATGAGSAFVFMLRTS